MFIVYGIKKIIKYILDETDQPDDLDLYEEFMHRMEQIL